MRNARFLKSPWLIILLLWGLHTTTFISKPPHIDDTGMLAAARHLTQDPLRPANFVLNWFQRPELAHTMRPPNPPLFNYLQALVMMMFGLNLYALHLLSSGFVLLAAVAAYWLANRFTPRPALCLLIFMLSPTLLPATNLMLDVPALALLLSSLAAWVKGIDEDRPGWKFAGAALAGVSILTKYTAVVVLPLLLLYTLLKRDWTALKWAVVPFAILALWCVHNAYFLPGHPIQLLDLKATATSGTSNLWGRFIMALVVLGSSFLFLPAFFLLPAVKARPRTAIAVLAAGVAIVGAELAQIDFSIHPSAGEQIFFMVNGLVLLIAILLHLLTRWDSNQKINWHDRNWQDENFLLGWLFGITLFTALFAPNHSPRYYFPAFFAMSAALTRFPGYLPRWQVTLSLAAQICVGLTLVASDNLFARTSERFVRELREDRRLEGRQVLFVGHWGFQFHAERAGMRHTSVDEPPPPPGTVIAAVLDTFHHEFPPWLMISSPEGRVFNLESFRMMDAKFAHHPWPLQTLTFERGGFLYDCLYHESMPYALSAPAYRAHRMVILEKM